MSVRTINLHYTVSILTSLFLLLVFSFKPVKTDEALILSYIVDPTKQDLQFYLNDDHGVAFQKFEKLQAHLSKKGKDLMFAMNGGMYQKDHSPQGLYIEDGTLIKEINKSKNDFGNFYMAPNGVFCLTGDKEGVICVTDDFQQLQNIKYATQSGPMLLIDGAFHPKFIEGSTNLNIRNGVGILPDGKILFAMSKGKINFYDFASYFKQHGCKNALYLDGYVSRTYLPAKNYDQQDGRFGVIIAESRPRNSER